MAYFGQVLLVEQGQLQRPVRVHELTHGLAAQGAHPVQPFDRAQFRVDARAGEQAPISHEHHSLESEAGTQLGNLIGQGRGVCGVARIDFHGHRTSLGVAQQAVDDLQGSLPAVSGVAQARQFTGPSFEIARTHVVQHQGAVMQVALCQGLLDEFLALEQPVHGGVEILCAHVFQSQSLAQGGGSGFGMESTSSGQLGAGSEQARHDQSHATVSFRAAACAYQARETELLHGPEHHRHVAVGTGAQDGEAVIGRDEGFAPQSAADDLDEGWGQMGDTPMLSMG